MPRFPTQFHIRVVLIKSNPKPCHSRLYTAFKTYYAKTVTFKWRINAVFFLGDCDFNSLHTSKLDWPPALQIIIIFLPVIMNRKIKKPPVKFNFWGS